MRDTLEKKGLEIYGGVIKKVAKNQLVTQEL